MAKIWKGKTRAYRGTELSNQFSRDCKTDIAQAVVCMSILINLPKKGLRAYLVDYYIR